MLIQPIDYFLVVWFTLAAASTAYVAWDQYRNNPEPAVMKWGFILVTLYMGPIGLLLYVLADKEPRPGEHETFIKPLWKQGVGSTIHCVAGDATGIILAAAITATLGLAMWIDLIVEYATGFAFGLFIFQSLFTKSMMGGTYWQNVRNTFLPELISMNFMMAGMAPVMSFLMMGRDMRAMEPTELLFWASCRWAEAMVDMAAVDPRDVVASYGLDVRGNRELVPRIENGVKVFDLEAAVIRWTILPGVTVDAYAFNGQVPGPRLRFRDGERVRINLMNRLPESTTVHWHGLMLPNVMDGPAHITQEPIAKRELYRYEFTAVQSGTYFYHSHDHVDRQQSLGLYGAMIIDPAEPDPSLEADHEYTLLLQEWLLREGFTYPAMPMDGGQPNYFTINGGAYPATDTIRMRVGETLKVRFIGSNNGFIHPMHIHGGPFEVVAVDGETLQSSARYRADTVNVGPGQRYDVIWTARHPGKWLIHCHIGHHTTNNNMEMRGGGGLMMVIEVA